MAYLAPRAMGAALAACLVLLLAGGGNVSADLGADPDVDLVAGHVADQGAEHGGEAGSVGASASSLASSGAIESRVQAPDARGHAPAISGSAALASSQTDLARVPPAPHAAHATSVDDEEDSNRAVFWAWDFYHNIYYMVRAELVYRGDDAWVYVEHGAEVPTGTTKGLGALFEEAVYPRVGRSYGSAPNPGIDGEKAVTILLLDIRDPLYYETAPHTYYSGYFDPVNQRRQADLDPELPEYRSNEREMIYLDIAPTEAGGVVSRQTMAHEFAHLVLWYHDEHEDEWLVEGLCELAVWLSDLGHPREHAEGFLAAPDVSLTSWVGDIRDYGKVYLFMLYAHEQASARDPDWLRALVAHPGDGLQSLTEVLPIERPLPELLRDFAVAVYRDVPTAHDARLGFANLELSDSPTGDQLLRPVPTARGLDDLERTEVELAPWSWKGMAFAPAQDALDLEIVPDDVLCVGWAHEALGPVPLTRCVGPGEPLAWEVPSVRADSGLLQVFVANGLPLGNRMDLATAAHLSTQGVRSRLYVPLAVNH